MNIKTTLSNVKDFFDLDKQYRNRLFESVEGVQENIVLEKYKRKDGKNNHVEVVILPYNLDSTINLKYQLMDAGVDEFSLHSSEVSVTEEDMSQQLNYGLVSALKNEPDVVLVLPSYAKIDRQVVDAARLVENNHVYLLQGIRGFESVDALKTEIYDKKNDAEDISKKLKDFQNRYIRTDFSRVFRTPRYEDGLKGSIIPATCAQALVEEKTGASMGSYSPRKIAALMTYEPSPNLNE